MHVVHEKEGVKHRVKPYVFLEAKKEFYEYTIKDIRGIIAGDHLDHIHWDERDKPKLQRMHTDGK